MRARSVLTALLVLALAPAGRAAPSDDDVRVHLHRLGRDYAAPAREEAAAALVAAGARALPLLIETLDDPDAGRRAGALDVLGRLRDRRATPHILKAYRDNTDILVRCKAVEAAGKMADMTLFDWLSARARDSNFNIRCFGLWSLGELRHEKVLPVLLPVLEAEKGYALVTAIDALGKCADARYAVRTLEFLKYADIRVRFVTAKALERLATPAQAAALFDALERETDWEVQEALAQTLGKTGGDAAVNRFIDMMKDGRSPLKTILAETGLAAAGLEALYPTLALLDADSVPLKVSAARVLGALGASSAVEGLAVQLLHPNAAVRVAAASALGRCGDTSVLNQLVKIGRDRDPAVRQAAAEAIEAIGRRTKAAAGAGVPRPEKKRGAPWAA